MCVCVDRNRATMGGMDRESRIQDTSGIFELESLGPHPKMSHFIFWDAQEGHAMTVLDRVQVRAQDG